MTTTFAFRGVCMGVNGWRASIQLPCGETKRLAVLEHPTRAEAVVSRLTLEDMYAPSRSRRGETPTLIIDEVRSLTTEQVAAVVRDTKRRIARNIEKFEAKCARVTLSVNRTEYHREYKRAWRLRRETDQQRQRADERRRREAMSPEERRKEQDKKRRKYHQEYRRKRLDALSPDERGREREAARDYARQRRDAMTAKERESHRVARRARYRKRQAAVTPEEVDV